jgi:hypothetical protein
MNDRDQRALARAARQAGQAGVAQLGQVMQAPINAGNPGAQGQGAGQAPGQVHAAAVPAAAIAAAPLVVDPGMWLNMVNVKTPQLSDLELESMKKFILDYKRYSQKCPQPLLRGMQQFILEEHFC